MSTTITNGSPRTALPAAGPGLSTAASAVSRSDRLCNACKVSTAAIRVAGSDGRPTPGGQGVGGCVITRARRAPPPLGPASGAPPGAAHGGSAGGAPPVSRSMRLGSVLSHDLQHAGPAACVKGCCARRRQPPTGTDRARVVGGAS